MSSKITTRKDGRKMMSYWVTLSNGLRKRQYVYGHTSEEVRKKYDEAVVAAYQGHPVNRVRMTFEQFLLEWLPTARKIRESTRYNYAGEIRKHIIPKVGKIKLSNLNEYHFQQLMDSLIKEGVSPRTTQIIKNILSKALKNAEAQNLVKPGLLKNVELETYIPKEREIWDDKDTKTFKEVIKSHKYYFIYLMCLTYGLRRGEAIAIRWEDVDFEKSVIHIRKQYTFVAGKPTICELKTKNSARDLEILPHIEKELKRLSGIKNGEYVLSDNGNPINPTSVNYEFKKIIKQNNLRDVAFHSLRHFVATTFKDLGVSIKDAQKILGHSSLMTTMEHYQHSTSESKKTALEKYAQKMGF